MAEIEGDISPCSRPPRPTGQNNRKLPSQGGGVMAAIGLPMHRGCRIVPARGVSCVVGGLLRLVVRRVDGREIGRVDPMSRFRAECGITSFKVPCRDGVSRPSTGGRARTSWKTGGRGALRGHINCADGAGAMPEWPGRRLYPSAAPRVLVEQDCRKESPGDAAASSCSRKPARLSASDALATASSIEGAAIGVIDGLRHTGIELLGEIAAGNRRSGPTMPQRQTRRVQAAPSMNSPVHRSFFPAALRRDACQVWLSRVRQRSSECKLFVTVSENFRRVHADGVAPPPA